MARLVEGEKMNLEVVVGSMQEVLASYVPDFSFMNIAFGVSSIWLLIVMLYFLSFLDNNSSDDK